MRKIDICRQIAREMDRYQVDGYWYGRHKSVITKVTVKNTTGDAVEDLAQEILRVGSNGYRVYPLTWSEEYRAEIYDETQPYSLVWDWKYRNAIKDKIQELRGDQ